MKKLLLLVLLIIGCDILQEEDCAFVAGGTAVEDCAGVCNGTSVLSGCDNACNSTAVADCAGTCDGTAVEDDCGVCDSDSTNDCVTGTYTLAAVAVYKSLECSGDARTGDCQGYDIENEAECPVGRCYIDGDSDKTILTQTDCETAQGIWRLGRCEAEDGEGILTEAECPNDWEPFGWIEFIDQLAALNFALTFNDDTNCTSSGFYDGPCTWELTDSDITINLPAYCDDDSYTTQSDCETQAEYGGWNSAITWSGTVAAGSTSISFHSSEQAYCDDSSIDNLEGCESEGHSWHTAECMALTFTH